MFCKKFKKISALRKLKKVVCLKIQLPDWENWIYLFSKCWCIRKRHNYHPSTLLYMCCFFVLLAFEPRPHQAKNYEWSFWTLELVYRNAPREFQVVTKLWNFNRGVLKLDYVVLSIDCHNKPHVPIENSGYKVRKRELDQLGPKENFQAYLAIRCTQLFVVPGQHYY